MQVGMPCPAAERQVIGLTLFRGIGNGLLDLRVGFWNEEDIAGIDNI
jgi:hypothetical protein